MAIATTYTQDDLDADIVAITDSIETVIDHVGRIKDNWVQVQALHPGVTAVEYIRDNVPYLVRNTAAAVALVEAGKTTVSDAARLTGRSKQAVSKAVAKTSSTLVDDAQPKPTTLATGKTAPGPAVGTTTKEVEVKEKPPTIAVPVIAGLPTPPAVQPPSPLVAEAIRLLKQVAALDATAIAAAQTAEQHQHLKRAAERAGKVCDRLARPLLIFP